MEQYYRILELEPGASKAEIKKAYFRLVRQHTPEKEPEMFQKIRNAYEQLNKEAGEGEGMKLPVPEDAFAKKMLDQIYQYRDMRYEEGERDTCEEAVKRFPDEILFRYLSVQAYRKCGNTGKAVKAAEALVKLEPQNQYFYRELAVSYMERGFTQKAYSACEKAYELGCRDIDFILLYAEECGNYGGDGKGVDLLLEVLGRDIRWKKDDMPDLVEIVQGLLYLEQQGGLGRLEEISEEISKVWEKYSIYMKEYVLDFSTALMAATDLGKVLWEPVDRLWNQLVQMADKEQREEIKQMRVLLEIARVRYDRRLGEVIEFCSEVYLLADAFGDYEGMTARDRKYAALDAKLCVLEEKEKVLPMLEILQKEYPLFYGKLGEIAALIHDEENYEENKKRLLKEYIRMTEMLEDGGGMYAQRYMDNMFDPSVKVISNGNDGVPFVRQNAKIGRNDPCPCGSGKKYKQCCMKKNA